MKKQIFFTVLFFLAALPAGAQLYQPGEVLDYRASYKAKFFPNTEVGSVRVTTVEEEYEGEPMYASCTRQNAPRLPLGNERGRQIYDSGRSRGVEDTPFRKRYPRRQLPVLEQLRVRLARNDGTHPVAGTPHGARYNQNDVAHPAQHGPVSLYFHLRSIDRQRSRKEKRRCSKCSSKIRSAICGTAFWGVKPRKSAVWVRSAP